MTKFFWLYVVLAVIATILFGCFDEEVEKPAALTPADAVNPKIEIRHFYLSGHNYIWVLVNDDKNDAREIWKKLDVVLENNGFSEYRGDGTILRAFSKQSFQQDSVFKVELREPSLGTFTIISSVPDEVSRIDFSPPVDKWLLGLEKDSAQPGDLSLSWQRPAFATEFDLVFGSSSVPAVHESRLTIPPLSVSGGLTAFVSQAVKTGSVASSIQARNRLDTNWLGIPVFVNAVSQKYPFEFSAPKLVEGKYWLHCEFEVLKNTQVVGFRLDSVLVEINQDGENITSPAPVSAVGSVSGQVSEFEISGAFLRREGFVTQQKLSGWLSGRRPTSISGQLEGDAVVRFLGEPDYEKVMVGNGKFQLVKLP